MRLEAALRNQKAFFKAEISEIKTKIEPIRKIISFLGVFTSNTGNGSSLAKTGVSMGIDLLLRDKLLRRFGWLPRAVLPLMAKGVANVLMKIRPAPK